MIEMLANATEIHFGPGSYIVRLGQKPYEYGLVVNGEYGRGDYSSFEEAFTEMKEQENNG